MLGSTNIPDWASNNAAITIQHHHTWNQRITELQAPTPAAIPQTLRFDHPECIETRSWEQILEDYKYAPHMFTSGGLGMAQTPDFGVYCCFRGHPCLSKVAPEADETESMCFLYHDGVGSWHPWILRSERNICNSRVPNWVFKKQVIRDDTHFLK